MASSFARLQTRHYLTAGTLIMGLALTASAYRTAEEADHAQRRIGNAGVFATHLTLVRSAIQQHLDVLYSVRSLYWASDFVTREEFRVFVMPLLARYPSTRAVEWIPRVTGQTREQIEVRGAEELIGPFELTEADVDGVLSRAAERNVYYPVFYVEPQEHNRRALGYDLGSNSQRGDALGQALHSREVVVSERIRPVQELGESSAVISLLSVSGHAGTAGTADGLVGAVLQPGRLLTPLIERSKDVVRMTLTDVSDAGEPKLLANALAAASEELETGVQSAQFDVGGRIWRLDTEIRLSSMTPALLTGAQGAAAVGIAITFLSMLLITVLSRRHERDLEKRRRSKAMREVISAQDGERRQIAQEIHDLCGQAAIGIKLRLRTLLERVLGDDDLHEELSMAWQVSADIVDQLESFSRGLHPTVLDDYGLQSALGRLLADARRVGGIEVAEVFQGFRKDERLSRELEATLYRVAQESVANVLRHAGAKNLSLVCNRTTDSVRLTINDDGRGFDPGAVTDGGIGLRGMSERVESLGGHFNLESSAEDGTIVLAELPLRR